MYNSFAQIYDFLSDPAFYENWLKLLDPYLDNSKKILDLGCGNGVLLEKLIEKNQRVLGVDASSEMLMLAADRLQGNQYLFEADMAEFYSGPSQYDIIMSTCDSVNYLPEQTLVTNMFKNCYEMLVDGGFFMFDVHSDFTFQERFTNWSYGDATEELSLIWNIDTEDGFLYEHYLTFFSLQTDGKYLRFDDIQREYFYQQESLKKALEVQGFRHIQMTSDFTPDFSKTGNRTIFIAQK